MATDRVLDIFYLLSEIDKKNYSLWENFTEEQKKAFSPLVVMRWMGGMLDPVQLIFLNEIVNPVVFNLGSDHKEFLLKLLTVCSNGKSKRYSWINYKVTSGKNKKLAIGLISEHYRIPLREAEDSLKLFTSEEILELAEQHGFQKDELAALKKESKSCLS